MTAQAPKPHQGSYQPHALFLVSRFGLGPCPRRSQVIIVALQAIQPFHLTWAAQLRCSFFCQAEEVGQVTTPDGPLHSGFEQPVLCELPDNLQQPVTPSPAPVFPVFADHQRFVDEVCQEVQDIVTTKDDRSISSAGFGICAHRLGGGEREAAPEDRQAGEEGSFRAGKQREAPVEGSLQTLMAGWG